MDIPSASLEGNVALVTGAAQGIGKGMALGLAKFGADIAILDVNEEGARETATEIRAMGRKATVHLADVRDYAQTSDVVNAALAEHGAIQVLVNNVGGNVGRIDFIETAEVNWLAAIQLNLMPTIHCIRLVAPEMIARGIKGSIINVSTIEAYRAAPGYAVYAAAKAGVISLTQTLALELGHHGIRVNAIAPDVTQTPRVRMSRTTEGLAARGAELPAGRVGRPEDYAGSAVYLASDLSAWITGETVHVGGGTNAASGWIRNPKGQWVTSLRQPGH